MMVEYDFSKIYAITVNFREWHSCSLNFIVFSNMILTECIGIIIIIIHFIEKYWKLRYYCKDFIELLLLLLLQAILQ